MTTDRPKPPDPPPALAAAGLARVGDVARACGVTDQTIYNWIDEGLPVHHVEPGAGPNGGDAKWFDLEDVQAWVKRHKPKGHAIHGGKRSGAGRKGQKRRSSEETKFKSTSELRNSVSSSAAPHSEDVTNGGNAGPGGNAHIETPGRSASSDESTRRAGTELATVSTGVLPFEEVITREQLKRAAEKERHLGDMAGVFALIDAEEITAAEAHAACKVLEAKAKAIENAERLGQLVEVNDMRVEITRAMGKVRTVLDDLPDRIAARAISDLGLDKARQAQLRDLVRNDVERACGALVQALEK